MPLLPLKDQGTTLQPSLVDHNKTSSEQNSESIGRWPMMQGGRSSHQLYFEGNESKHQDRSPCHTFHPNSLNPSLQTLATQGQIHFHWLQVVLLPAPNRKSLFYFSNGVSVLKNLNVMLKNAFNSSFRCAHETLIRY